MAEENVVARAAESDRAWWTSLAAVALMSATFCLLFWNTNLSPTAGGELMLMTPATRDFLPYRDYFIQKYGGVQYERDPRPVSCLVINNPECQSAENPLGSRSAPMSSRTR